MSDHPETPIDSMSDQSVTSEVLAITTSTPNLGLPDNSTTNSTSSEVPVEVNAELFGNKDDLTPVEEVEEENPASTDEPSYQDSTELDQEQTIQEQGEDQVISDYSETFCFSKLKSDFQPELFGQVPFDTYTRGCKWSPDGLCILTLSDDNRLKIFDTPSHEVDSTNGQGSLQAAVTMKEAETVYDFQWFPLMDSNKPETCCLATTSQYQPIHLYDAFDGHLRATYRCFDHLDELVASRSLCFDPHGEKLYTGLKNEIRVFDVNIPGRECEVRKTLLKKRKSNEFGLCGIISCIAFNPVMPSVFALGTYSRHLGVYLEPLKLVCMHEGQQKGGITHVQFTPDGTKLLAGGRKDKEILVWDLRNPGTLYAVLHRVVTTNQRIFFDISSCGQFVVSGGSDSKLRIWDLKSDLSPDFDDPVIDPMWIGANLHSDCINGVSIHPWRNYLSTSSGQRHFEQNFSDEESGKEEDTTKSSSAKSKTDFSLRFWNFEKLLDL